MENKDTSPQFFLTNLSHEIRTPLNGIVGYTQLLSQTKLDTTQQVYLNSMTHCCIQLVELINDILDFSKLTTGKAQINNECFSFSEIIDEINSTLGFRLKEKKQKISFVIEENLPKYLISDKHKILQILINLISNSNKFTPIGGRIIVSFSRKNDNQINCSVEDDGIGITHADQQKIFQPFVQIEETLIKNGAGLGLAICKKLVELLGGVISIDSEKNCGAIFSFFFNFEPYENYQTFIKENGEILKGSYILIVDDNVDNRLFLSELLFEYETTPIICSSGKEALRMVSAKRYPFKLAILDICMPEISGIELSKQLKQIKPELPLIAISSLDQVFDKLHFEYVLQKPIDKIKLLDHIIRTFNKNNIKQYELNENKNNFKKGNLDSETKENNNIKILIAEDISYNSEMLSKMLNSMGFYQIDTASDGLEAIEKIKKNSYDILILDLKMPKMDGFGVAEFIKNNNLTYLKVAVVTASVSEKDRDRCKELGVKFFLLKPFNMTHLKTILEKLLKS